MSEVGMTVLKIINEGLQWAAIVILLALLFFIGIDFFSSCLLYTSDAADE